MNKRQISERIFRELGIEKYEAYTFIDLFIEAVTECLATGDKVVVSNFGTFKVVAREPKRVLNPNDGSEMIIPACKVVKFLPSRKLKTMVGGE